MFSVGRQLHVGYALKSELLVASASKFHREEQWILLDQSKGNSDQPDTDLSVWNGRFINGGPIANV